MVAQAVEKYLASQKAKASGAAAETWGKLESHYVDKQWHQLTEALKKALKDPAFLKGLNLMELHKEFISDFASRINALSLVQIMGPIAASVPPPEGVAFLDETKKRLVKDLAMSEVKSLTHREALVLCNAYIANLKLGIKDEAKKVKDIQEVRALVEETGKMVEELPGVTEVHGDFHKVYAAYLCEVADHAGYYREALRYLACAKVDEMSGPEQKLLAQRLCLSALLGKDVYDFGALLSHPLLHCLQGTPEQWLLDLVKLFNAGDIPGFDAAKPKWAQCFDIKSNEVALRDKLRLLAVMDAAFKTPPSERRLSFKALAQRLNVPVDKVEVLVMRTLSRGLVRGHIDQVDQIVHFTWVQPRVLDKALINAMSSRISDWAQEVKKTSDFISHNAKDIIIK